MGKYQSGQMGQTVNLLAYAFGGSNPSLPTLESDSSRKKLSDFFVYTIGFTFFNILSLNNHKQLLRSHILDLYLYNKLNNTTMPTILIIFGLRFYFFANEHLPIHVHLENSDGLAKIALEPEIKLVENNGIKPKDIKRAMTIVEQYREEFIEKWIEFHGE